MADESPIRIAKAEENGLARAFSVPALPRHFVARSSLAEEVVQWFSRDERQNWHTQFGRDARRVVLRTDLGVQRVGGRTRSAGGFGKTTLAMALCVDVRIREHFPDGIRWLSFGPQPDLLQLANGLARSFDAELPICCDINLAIKQLRDVLWNKQVLLVLDDVWQKAHTTPFLFDTTAYLITTRWPDLVDFLIKIRYRDFWKELEYRSMTRHASVALDQMCAAESTAFISNIIVPDATDQQPLRELALYFGRWPPLLELVGEQLRQLMVRNQKSLPQAIAQLRERLVARGFAPFDPWDDDACCRALEIALSVSIALERKSVTVNQMSVDEATALLSNWLGLPAADEEPLRELAAYLGQWPLLLELVGGQLRHLVVRNQKSLPQAIAQVRERLVGRGFAPFNEGDDQARRHALERALSVSLHQLQALGEPGLNWCERYLELAIFPENLEIPCTTIFKLWQQTAGFEQHESQKALLAMRELSLLTPVVTTSGVPRLERLKSLLREPNEALLRDKHAALLAAHRPASGKWADLLASEPYMYHHLADHLCAAGQLEALGELLLEFDWLHFLRSEA